MRKISKIVKIILQCVAVFGVILNVAQAGVYRCKDASGATTYSQTPCKAGEQSQNMQHVQRTADPAMAQACKAAYKFSGEVYSQLQDGATPEQVMDEYGGVNYVNAPTLNIINYVGTFRHQIDTPNYQVQKLTSNKCRNSGFGRFAATDLPLSEEDLTLIGAKPTPPSAMPTQQPATEGASSTETTPDAQTIQQLEEYLEQLKAQQP